MPRWCQKHPEARLAATQMASATESADGEKVSTQDQPDPEQKAREMVREYVEEHGSNAHGSDYAPERVESREDSRQAERGENK